MKREYYLANKAKIIAQTIEYRLKNKDKVREWNRASYRRRKSYFIKWREEHRMSNREATRQYHQRLKLQIITHYGGGVPVCVHCGENRLPCLSIDHIHGGGGQHRDNGVMVGSGHALYRWLKRNNLPDGFQTLCMNCQSMKKFENKEYGKPKV